MVVKFENSKQTKARDAIVEDAKNRNASEEEIEFLSKIEVKAIILRQIGAYLEYQLQYYPISDLLDEVVRCLEIYEPKEDKKNCYILSYALPYWRKDVLLGSKKKQTLLNGRFYCYEQDLYKQLNSQYYLRMLLYNEISPQGISLFFHTVDLENGRLISIFDYKLLLKDFEKNREESAIYSYLIHGEIQNKAKVNQSYIFELLESYIKRNEDLIEKALVKPLYQELQQLSSWEMDRKLAICNPKIESFIARYFDDTTYSKNTIDTQWVEEIQSALRGVNGSITQDIYQVDARISSNHWLSIKFTVYQKLFFDKEKVFPGLEKKEFVFYITPNGNYMAKFALKDKIYPLQLKHLHYWCKQAPIFEEVITFLIEEEKKIQRNCKRIISICKGKCSCIHLFYG